MTGEKQDALKTGEVEAIKQLHERYLQIAGQLSGVIVGLDEVIGQLVIGLLCRGHCILEGVPGLAKTMLVSSVAQTLGLSFRRIQFTPDLMPADITGSDIKNHPVIDRSDCICSWA